MKRAGFNLIELMIVVAIIALLTTLALPQYRRYQAKARQAEVFVTLASLHTAQQAYYAQTGRYSTILAGPEGIGWKPEGYRGGGPQERFFYTYGFNVPGAQEGIHYFTGKLNAPKEALGVTGADQAGFCAGAACDVAGANRMDVWHVKQDRSIDNVQKGIE